MQKKQDNLMLSILRHPDANTITSQRVQTSIVSIDCYQSGPFFNRWLPSFCGFSSSVPLSPYEGRYEP